MKFRRFLSGLLFGLGCALMFIGILATVLPLAPNPQLQLVLGSFSMSSDNAAVQMINRAMSLALAQNWRVLILGAFTAGSGAWLFLYFTPKKSRPLPIEKEPSASSPTPSVPETEIDPAPQAFNPFAAGTYLDHLPLREHKSAVSLVRHAAPILEPNRVEETPLPADPAPDCSLPSDEPAAQTSEPYFSSRFETESRAIASERGVPSQSGSRILIRHAFDASLDRTEGESTKDEPSTPAEETPSHPSAPLSAPAAMPPFSPRIRSTMGRKRTG